MISSCPSRTASPKMVSPDLVTEAVVGECMHGCICVCVCVCVFVCKCVCVCVCACMREYICA